MIHIVCMILETWEDFFSAFEPCCVLDHIFFDKTTCFGVDKLPLRGALHNDRIPLR